MFLAPRSRQVHRRSRHRAGPAREHRSGAGHQVRHRHEVGPTALAAGLQRGQRAGLLGQRDAAQLHRSQRHGDPQRGVQRAQHRQPLGGEVAADQPADGLAQDADHRRARQGELRAVRPDGPVPHRGHGDLHL